MANKQSAFPLRRILRTSFFVPATVFSLVVLAGAARAQEPLHSLELSRAVRPWEFLPVTGMRAGLLGDESGRMEAWVYPLKILREFHLKFHTERSEEHTSELQSQSNLVCRLLLEKKKPNSPSPSLVTRPP